jgi:mono/diheme cytochrome c family protein
MPPFPQLDDTQLAAVATYIRNSWGNSFGGVSPEEVTAIRADLGPAEATRTIWDGVYTEDQAERGNEVYRSSCGTCHGTRLNGVPDDQDMSPAPPLARANFLRNWDQRSLGSVFAYSHSTMPLSNPGFLTQEQYADIVALMLSTTGAPAGDEELPPDHVALGHIIITPQP